MDRLGHEPVRLAMDADGGVRIGRIYSGRALGWLVVPSLEPA
jgi:hypothetical protein